MRTVIIGDVHGMTEALKALFALAVRPDDRVVFVGDLLDKGPDSAGTVRFVREAADRQDVVLVLGNHEEKHARFRKHLRNGDPKLLTGHEEMGQITAQLSALDVDFLSRAVPYFDLGNGQGIVVHGGICANITALDDPKALRYLCRTRYVDGNGRFVGLGDETDTCQLWGKVYDGRFGRVFYGHNPFDAVQIDRHAIGLDTGAVFGGGLTAAIVDGSDLDFVSVPTPNMLNKLYC